MPTNEQYRIIMLLSHVNELLRVVSQGASSEKQQVIDSAKEFVESLENKK